MSLTPEPPAGDRTDSIARDVHAAITAGGLNGLPTLAAIIDRVATLHGKPIRLEQVGDAEWGSLTGLWVETPAVSRIFTRRTDPVAYQVVCALHEVMHILLNHPSCLPTISELGLSLPPGARRARNAGSAFISRVQASYESEAEFGARVLAQALLHGLEDPVERRFG